MVFEDVLAAWLVKQRWFAGKGRTVHDLAVVADTEIIPGDPGLRHLLVTVSHGATSDCYQLFIGSRPPPPAPPPHRRIRPHPRPPHLHRPHHPGPPPPPCRPPPARPAR